MSQRLIPLPTPQFVNQPLLGLLLCDLKRFKERLIGGFDSQVACQDQKRLAKCLDNCVVEVIRDLQSQLTHLDSVDVREHQHGTVDSIIGSTVGMQANAIPVAIAVLDFLLDHLNRRLYLVQ